MTPIGIDLGTTNSAAGFCEAERREPRILANSSGENLTPSVVGLRRRRGAAGESELLVGRAAVNNAPAAPEDTVYSIKRLMGRTFGEPRVAQVREKFNYTVVPAPEGDPGLRVRLGDKDYSPIEVSAKILTLIKEDASQALGRPVTHAVITVPAYFEERQRAATREAGARAGLIVKKIIDEPTAAAIAFGVQVREGERHRVLVFDLGGGTFDISILQMVKDNAGRHQFQVLQIEGDNWLGGDDFDSQIVERILQWVRDTYHTDAGADKRFLLLARQNAERAKIALGAATNVDIVIPAALKVSGEMIDVDLPLTRAEFNGMIQGYVERSMDLVRKALQEQHLTPDDISDVLMVGGSTLVPLVFETVQAYFGANKVRRTVNPMECVALGASVLAATLKGVECPGPSCHALNDEAAVKCSQCGHSLAGARIVSDTVITETAAQSLGIGAVEGARGDVFVPIIPKNTPYPLREPMKRIFKPTNGRLIKVPVYEGDNPVASRNEEQGVVEFELPQNIDINTPVEVSFNYDRNRELTVLVRVQGSTLEKIQTLRRDRERTPPPTAEGDEENWREDLEETIDFSRRFLTNYGGYIDLGQRSKLETDVERARGQLLMPVEPEAKRLTRLLRSDVWECTVAWPLFLAERALDGAPANIAERLNRSITDIKHAYAAGDSARVHQVLAALRPVVAQTLERRTGIPTVGDQQDFGGLLKVLGS